MDQSFPYTELSDINFIAMYGGTGVGKSQFVNDATGRQEMTVGHDLHSCTQKVAASQPFVLDGQNVVLFDTPGFDDTTMSDADTLKRIAEFMETMYRRGMKLKGLVYMHRISDLRMAGASARTYRLLRSLCGTENLANVVICTNMWSIPPSEDEVRREDQLKTEFFNSALASGARMVRRTELGQKTAHDVLRMLLPLKPGTPQIMREMIHDNVPLAETEAGKYVEAELRLKLEKQEREIQEIRKELDDALHECNNKAREDLERYRTKKESELSMLRKQLASLAVEIEEGKLFWDQQFEDLRAWRIQAMRLADEQGNLGYPTMGRDY